MPDARRQGIKAARPAIEIAGQDEPALGVALLELCVTETTIGLYRCEARFGNWGQKPGQPLGFQYFDRKKLDFGKKLKIKIADETIFDGVITALEGIFPEGATSEVAIFAEDRLQDLRMTRRTRTFSDVTDEDVFRQIAQDHSLSTELSVTGPTHEVLAQLNQSDLAFLRDRARATGVEVWVDGSTLKAKPRASRRGQPVKLALGTELYEASALADLAEQRSSVSVSGWDPSSKDAISESADSAAVSAELGNDEGGGSILDSALGRRVESLAHRVPLSADEARSCAEAHYRDRARRFVVLRARAAADARLRAGTVVELSGMGDLFSGRYYLSEVRHIFDEKGLRTEMIGERPGLGRAQ
jgi:phage protein D